ncbi:hypothetical protein PSAB6_410008 [Paraburkholderia sabiae]|nr:hypothetical protein PSAB6_410008 [Paraburkholderia sabiae]
MLVIACGPPTGPAPHAAARQSMLVASAFKQAHHPLQSLVAQRRTVGAAQVANGVQVVAPDALAILRHRSRFSVRSGALRARLPAHSLPPGRPWTAW